LRIFEQGTCFVQLVTLQSQIYSVLGEPGDTDDLVVMEGGHWEIEPGRLCPSPTGSLMPFPVPRTSLLSSMTQWLFKSELLGHLLLWTGLKAGGVRRCSLCALKRSCGRKSVSALQESKVAVFSEVPLALRRKGTFVTCISDQIRVKCIPRWMVTVHNYKKLSLGWRCGSSGRVPG
jgi:hypothetical protein